MYKPSIISTLTPYLPVLKSLTGHKVLSMFVWVVGASLYVYIPFELNSCNYSLCRNLRKCKIQGGGGRERGGGLVLCDRS